MKCNHVHLFLMLCLQVLGHAKRTHLHAHVCCHARFHDSWPPFCLKVFSYAKLHKSLCDVTSTQGSNKEMTAHLSISACTTREMSSTFGSSIFPIWIVTSQPILICTDLHIQGGLPTQTPSSLVTSSTARFQIFISTQVGYKILQPSWCDYW